MDSSRKELLINSQKVIKELMSKSINTSGSQVKIGSAPEVMDEQSGRLTQQTKRAIPPVPNKPLPPIPKQLNKPSSPPTKRSASEPKLSSVYKKESDWQVSINANHLSQPVDQEYDPYRGSSIRPKIPIKFAKQNMDADGRKCAKDFLEKLRKTTFEENRPESSNNKAEDNFLSILVSVFYLTTAHQKVFFAELGRLGINFTDFQQLQSVLDVQSEKIAGFNLASVGLALLISNIKLTIATPNLTTPLNPNEKPQPRRTPPQRPSLFSAKAKGVDLPQEASAQEKELSRNGETEVARFSNI